jgi:GxxExxY protein
MLLHRELTEEILHVFFVVYNYLGYGFLEKVYQNAMYLELKERGFQVDAQKKCEVRFKGKVVGEYFADLVVNDLVILELKACESIVEDHKHQLLNYLKTTDIEIGLLLNFGKEPEFCRRIFSNEKKKLSHK